jgi:hypothetical protein
MILLDLGKFTWKTNLAYPKMSERPCQRASPFVDQERCGGKIDDRATGGLAIVPRNLISPIENLVRRASSILAAVGTCKHEHEAAFAKRTNYL